MNTTKCYASVLFAFAISLGYFSEKATAQPTPFDGYNHSGSCAGGCSQVGINDSLELIPYSQAGQAMVRQGYPSQRPYGPSDLASRRSGYSQQFQVSPQHRAARASAYRGNPMVQNDRRSRANYEMRREEFTYANDTNSGFSSRGNHGPGGCRGGCSHGQPGGGYDLRRNESSGGYAPQRFEGDGQSSFDRGLPNGIEADQAPQLNWYRPDRGNPTSAYGQTRPGPSVQMRPEYINPQQQRRTVSPSEDTYSPIGPPPTSVGVHNGSVSSGHDHAGCDHDHN